MCKLTSLVKHFQPCFVKHLRNRWKPLTIITKRSILDVAAALYPPPGFPKSQSLIILTLTSQKCEMTLLRDKIDSCVAPKQSKFVKVLSHTAGNVQCDKSLFPLSASER